ncbi:GLUTAMATE RECEPTOR [Salix viminalis]|uniref:Glutamate receptor n=1 Tax=Salix viminalis TaxID=40686 RepID=A0A9Q0TB42_SALVM|nr:GLUTAMATE RECEPTOR [Salix viminalis]
MKRTNRILKPCILLSVLITFLPIFSNGVEAAIGTNKVTNIGAIIDVNSRIGKEEKTALEMAVQNFNLISTNHELALHLRHPGEDPLQVAYAAKELIKEKKVKVIIGMDKWEEAALVANIGNQYRIPILSFATPAITPPLTTLRWPFLMRMASDGSEQMRCIAALVGCYNWRKVVVVYEDNVYGGESGNLALLSEDLREVGAEIAYHLVLPPFSLSTDLKDVVHHELIKLQKDTESRVFIVLQSSLPMLTYLFREAKNMGLVGRDTAWILSNSITSFLDSMNNSVISSMEGALGIQTYYSSSSSYQSFEAQFRKIFRAEYQDEDNFLPGIQALRAYDSIGMVTQAIEKFGSDSISPKMLLNSVLGSDFTGLTGEIHFKDGMLSDAPTLRIVNVVGKKYKELDFWSNPGFSKTLYAEDGKERCSNSSVCNITGCLSGPVIWPGDLNDRDPKGWALPTNARPLRIVVPKRTSFDKFVTFQTGDALPEGFCIDIFHEVVERLNYSLPHEFFEHDGLYDEMIVGVYNKTYDAAIGDITILAERTKYVEFTQPYAESGLSMIVPFANKDSAWIFMKPFSLQTWIVSGAIFIYTLLIVWFLEHQSNPYFRGLPLKVQIENALWLLSCSLFFIHAEKLYSNLTRIVVVMWLFVVFICTASYTANLTSMLTVQRMEEPNFSEYKIFQTKHLTVGCDNDSFVQNYLERAFQKGSPIASDFSRAILRLSEKGTLKTLEERWFAPSPECSPTATNNNVERLSLGSFKGIYIVSATISTICFLLVLIPLVRNSRNHQEANEGNVTPSGKSGASKGGEVSKPFYNGDKTRIPRRASTFTQALDTDRWGSSRWERVSNSDNLENHHEDSSQAEIEMA